MRRDRLFEYARQRREDAAVLGFHLLRALWQSRALVRARKPRAMFSTGGYVAVPAGMAASTLGVPLIVLNSDAAPLMSTSMLKPLASAVLCGFDGSAARRAGPKGEVTGKRVRAEIAQIRAPELRFAGRTGPLQLLIIGGSLGARVLNENVPRALALIAAEKRPHVVHQCGAAHVDSVRALYQTLDVEAEVIAFIDDMPARYALADVVVCRAGAITVAELAVAGVASVLVPLIVSTTSHQRDNAQYMAAHDAAIHLPQAELTPQRLANLLRELTRDRLLQIAQAARSIAEPMRRSALPRPSSGWPRDGRAAMKHAGQAIHFVASAAAGCPHRRSAAHAWLPGQRVGYGCQRDDAASPAAQRESRSRSSRGKHQRRRRSRRFNRRVRGQP